MNPFTPVTLAFSFTQCHFQQSGNAEIGTSGPLKHEEIVFQRFAGNSQGSENSGDGDGSSSHDVVVERVVL